MTAAANPSMKATVRALLPLVSPQEKRRFAWLLALSLVMALCELALAGGVALLAAAFGSPEAVMSMRPLQLLREQFGLNFINDPRYLCLVLLVGITLLIAARNGFGMLQQQQQTRFSENVGMAVRMRIFSFYQRAPYLWILHTGTAELHFGMMAGNSLASATNFALQAGSTLLMLLILFGGLIAVSPFSSLLFLCVLVCVGTLSVRATRGLQNRCAQSVYTADYSVSKIIHLALHGLKEMRLYRREAPLLRAFADTQAGAARAKVQQQTLARLPVMALELLGFASLLGIMLFLIQVQDAGIARVSGVMGFMAAAAWRGLPMANRLVEAGVNVRASLPYLHKIVSLLALAKRLRPQLLPLDDATAELDFKKDIALENVSFSYPRSEAGIRHVSLRIRKGEMLGLVGLSGAGKSTLVNLLTGLLPPDAGRLLVDGVPVTCENMRAWLRRIGYVAQSPYILDATLAENVALSRWGERIDRDHVLQCCRMAAMDFVDQLEDGIDTHIGERGVRLSGGQAQRVAIARALYSKPELIVFDEATSSLDMKNEKAIYETILSLRSAATMIIVAHRLTTVATCDVLVWLDEGRVHMIGKPEIVLPEYQRDLEQERGTHAV